MENKPAIQKIAEQFLPGIHQLFDEKRVNPATKYLDIDILICCMLEAHEDALELKHHEMLEASRSRHYNHTTILIMVSALLGGFAFWLGTLVGR